MMSDLVKRARATYAVWNSHPDGVPPDGEVVLAMADRIEALEREKQDLAIGYAEYKKLYEAGCETWRPAFKQQADRLEALEAEVAMVRTNTLDKAAQEAQKRESEGGEYALAAKHIARAILTLKEK